MSRMLFLPIVCGYTNQYKDAEGWWCNDSFEADRDYTADVFGREYPNINLAPGQIIAGEIEFKPKGKVK